MRRDAFLYGFVSIMLLSVQTVFAQTPNPGAAPGAQQLLQTPIGGTRIPRETPAGNLRNPYEGNSAAIAQGRQLFKSMNCNGCHAPQGAGGMGPALSDAEWIYGSEPAQIFLTVVQGRPNGMPSFARALPEDDIWKLVAYVRTLSEIPGRKPPPASQPQETGKP